MRRLSFVLIVAQLWCANSAVSHAQMPQKSTALEKADADLAAGRKAEAAAEYRAIADNYGSARALLQLARIQASQGDASALKTLESARVLAPNSEEILSAIAQVSLAARLVVPAILTLQTLTRIAPDVAEYHYLFGVALMQGGDMIPAGESLQRAEQLEPHRALTLVALGLVLNNRKLFADSRKYLLRALELEPESPEANAALAEAEDGLGETASAEARARRVLERAPDNATALLVLGMTLLEQGRLPDARTALEKAADADPVSPKPNYQLSLVFSRLGDEAHAREQVEIYRQKLQAMNLRLEQIRSKAGLPGSGGMK